MGAFGRYLQARLGGTKHDVSTWTHNKQPKEVQKEEYDYSIPWNKLSVFQKTAYIRYLKENNICIVRLDEIEDYYEGIREELIN